MNRYEVRIVRKAQEQSYSAHRVEATAVERMREVARLLWVERALVVDRNGPSGRVVIARAARTRSGGVVCYWTATEEAVRPQAPQPERSSGRAPTP